MPKTPARDIQALYYITHKNNVPSILREGIYSHRQIEERGIQSEAIYDKGIVNNRKDRIVSGDKSLWDFANFYFNARNPMLYRVRHENHDVVVIRLRRDVLETPGAYISIGNAAAEESHIYPVKEGITHIRKKENWEKIHAEFWNSTDDGKRMIMSELLIPGHIPPSQIDGIYTPDNKTRDTIEKSLTGSSPLITAEPGMFFLPSYKKKIARNISLVDGDMFFSSMQTFTISVNTQGVMGKGLASRAKYQFPDVYVKYQDACQSKKLSPQKPFLYKRESSLDIELADMPEYLQKPNASRWFLLFATKRRWQDDSRMEDIESGMQWLAQHYKKEGIESLALPALGCGLGKLTWAEVGPLMCKILEPLDIHSTIYLPREAKPPIPEEQKTPDFLLQNTHRHIL